MIGAGTKIWINVQIRENADNWYLTALISKDVYIDHAVKIGNRCKIQNSVSVYSGVTIEDDVFVGPNVAFTNDKVPRAFNTDWTITPTLIESELELASVLMRLVVCGIVIGQLCDGRGWQLL